jgi:SEC-C motif-containing protein
MRSRYSAFEKQQIDYLRDTLTEESRKTFDKQATTDWAKNSKWNGLEIHETEKGQPGDKEGIVEFTAHFVMEGKEVDHRERALFSFDEGDGRWYYEDAIQAPKKPVVREATPGRNDPCSCGSGKKYKKCCAGKTAA